MYLFDHSAADVTPDHGVYIPPSMPFSPQTFQARPVIAGMVRNAAGNVNLAAQNNLIDQVHAAYEFSKDVCTTMTEMINAIGDAIRVLLPTIKREERVDLMHAV